MRNLDAITGDLLILAAIALAFFIGRSLRRNPTPPLTREPDLFDEQAALYGPARMYGRLEPIDAGDPFAGWPQVEFDRLCDDPVWVATFEAIQALPEREDAA